MVVSTGQCNTACTLDGSPTADEVTRFVKLLVILALVLAIGFGRAAQGNPVPGALLGNLWVYRHSESAAKLTPPAHFRSAKPRSNLPEEQLLPACVRLHALE